MATDGAEIVQQWDGAAWCLAALAVASRAEVDDALAAAAREVLSVAGLDVREFPGSPDQLAAVASVPLQLTATLAAGGRPNWAEHSDEALIAQGRASGMAGPMFARQLGAFGEFATRFTAPGARMLDVGTGTGALALGFAETFPELRVVGIDVLDRALELARLTVADRAAGERITFRKQDVATLRDDEGFDLAWLPAPFIPPPVLSPGVAAVVATLRPGGWLMVGHGRFGESPFADALTRLKTIAYGGSPLDADAARELLEAHGLVDVRTLQSPPGAPALTLGRAPGDDSVPSG